jgi:flagellar hook-basal body complex protein FliE
MAIQALSSEEVVARMRDLVARASAVQARIDLSSSNPSGMLQGTRGTGLAGSLEGSTGSQGSVDRVEFQEVLRAAVKGVSEAQNMAQTKAQAYQLGDDKISLEEVMISMQKASLALQGMVQVRNRLVEAYREVMNMQV